MAIFGGASDSLRNRSAASGGAASASAAIANEERRLRLGEDQEGGQAGRRVVPMVTPVRGKRGMRLWAGLLLASMCILVVLLWLLPDAGQRLSLYLPRMPLPHRLPCSGVHPDAESALRRASSERCRSEIADVACRNEEGSLHPERLPNLCPTGTDEVARGRYLGCYSDSFGDRIFQGVVHKLREANSPQRCLSLCSEAGYSYAGVQYSVECFCGNQAPASDRRTEEDRCDRECPGGGGGRDKCGGYLTMNVYQTGKYQESPGEGIVGGGEDGSAVRIVFLLTVSGRSVRQVRRLIKRIYSADHYLLIHVDARQDFMFRELSELEGRLDNVRMVKERFSTIWGGASLLQMHLSCIRELLRLHHWRWDYVLNLSESDYPLKPTPESLEEYLSSRRGKNFVKSHGRDASDFIRKQGLDRTFHQCDDHMWRLGPRKLPLGIQIDGGSDWICLHRDFARYKSTAKIINQYEHKNYY